MDISVDVPDDIAVDKAKSADALILASVDKSADSLASPDILELTSVDIAVELAVDAAVSADVL